MELVKVIGCEEFFVPLETQPADVFFDRIHVLGVFFFRVGVVETQVAFATKLLGNPKVQTDRFGVTNVQIAIGLRRESGLDSAVVLFVGDVLGNELTDKVEFFGSCFFGHGERVIRVDVRGAFIAKGGHFGEVGSPTGGVTSKTVNDGFIAAVGEALRRSGCARHLSTEYVKRSMTCFNLRSA